MKRTPGLNMLLACFVGFGAIFPSVDASAKELQICQSVSVSTSIRESAGRIKLVFTVKNTTSKLFEMHKFYLGENLLRFRAVASTGKELIPVIPFIGPGAKGVSIQPGGQFSNEIDLEQTFPELKSTLAASDVVISWELKLKPKNSCYSETIATAMTLKGRAK